MTAVPFEILFVLNDNILELIGLKDVVLDSFMNAATVTITLNDRNDVPVTGQTWPTAMDYVAASDGKYRAVLEDAMSLDAGKNYTAIIDADGGVNLKGHWEVELKAEIRTD